MDIIEYIYRIEYIYDNGFIGRATYKSVKNCIREHMDVGEVVVKMMTKALVPTYYKVAGKQGSLVIAVYIGQGHGIPGSRNHGGCRGYQGSIEADLCRNGVGYRNGVVVVVE